MLNVVIFEDEGDEAEGGDQDVDEGNDDEDGEDDCGWLWWPWKGEQCQKGWGIEPPKFKRIYAHLVPKVLRDLKGGEAKIVKIPPLYICQGLQDVRLRDVTWQSN